MLALHKCRGNDKDAASYHFFNVPTHWGVEKALLELQELKKKAVAPHLMQLVSHFMQDNSYHIISYFTQEVTS